MSVTEEIRTSTKEARYTATSRVRDYEVNRRLAIFLVAFLMGSVISPAGLSASAEQLTSHKPQPVAIGEYSQDLPPHEILGNGQTAGDWRLEDDPRLRPDFIPVILADGSRGYVRFTDMYGDPFGVDVDESTLEEIEDREPGARISPDTAGELWADVYDNSGEKVIGTWRIR